MTAFSDTFSDETGAAPSGWTQGFSTSNVTLTGQSATPGTMRLALTANLPHLVSLNALGTSTDCEILTRFRLTSVSTIMQSSTMQAGLMLRGSGTAGNEIGYAAVLMSNASNVGSHIRLARYSPAGNVATLGTDKVFAWSIGTWYWMRFRVNGTGNPSVQIRIWADDSPEPYSWLVDHVDSGSQRIVTSGLGGVFAYGCAGSLGTATWDYDFLSFATAGESAASPYARGAVYFNANASNDTTTPVAAIPAQCTQQWQTSDTTFYENFAGFFRTTNATTGRRHGLSIDAAGTAQAAQQVIVKLRAGAVLTASTACGVVLRGSGAAGAEKGYSWVMTEATGAKIRITKYDGTGASFILAETSFAWAANTWYWLRAEASGTALRLKIWADGGSEGSSWDIDTVDSGAIGGAAITTAGWLGAFSFSLTSHDFDYLGWATGGGVAPSPSSDVQDSFTSGSGLQPANWRGAWQLGNITHAENVGGFLRMASSAQARHALLWDAIPANNADVELLVKVRHDGNATRISNQPIILLMLRSYGAAAAENCYRTTIVDNALTTWDLNIGRYVGGVASSFTGGGVSSGYAFNVNEWHWIRFRASGTTITSKAWKDGTSEPASPQCSVTDSTFTKPGFSGVMSFLVGNLDVDFASYAVAGGVAPGPASFVSYVLDADTGPYTLTGTAAGLVYTPLTAYALAAATGSYTLNGQPAALVYAPLAAATLDEFNDGAGGAPNGWTLRWNTGGTTWTEQAAGHMRFANTTALRRGASFDAIGNVADVELTTRYAAHAQATSIGGLVVRGSGGIATERGYVAMLGNNSVTLRRYNGDNTLTDLVTVPFTYTTGCYQRIRFRAVGSSLKIRVWNDIEPVEPIAWTIDTTDTGITTAGWAGVFTFNATWHRFDWVGYGVAGASAPLVTNPRHWIGAYYIAANIYNGRHLGQFLGLGPSSERRLPLAFEFLGRVSKTDLNNTFNICSTHWGARQQYRLYISVPLATDNGEVTCANLASGAHDAMLDAWAAKLVADNHQDCLLRLGWEMNGNWYPWGVTGGNTAANYIAAFRHVVARIRLVPALSTVEFVWAPNVKFINGAPPDFYPGDDVVDWIAPDIYAQQYDHDNMTPDQIWDNECLGYDDESGKDQPQYMPGSGVFTSNSVSYSLRWFVNEAVQRNKKFGAGEIGIPFMPNKHGTGDFPVFWKKWAELLNSWGPPDGSVLCIFDIDPGDTLSSFTKSPNVPAATFTPPSTDQFMNWYEDKRQTAWTFRHYFGDLSVVPDLDTTGFETTGPTGTGVTLFDGYGTAPNLRIPIGTVNNAGVGQMTADPGTRTWTLDAGDSDGASTAGGINNQVVIPSSGWIGGSVPAPGNGNPGGGYLYIREGYAGALMSGRVQVLGFRNAVGGVNYNLNVDIVALTTTGTAKGTDLFGGVANSPPTGWHARWAWSVWSVDHYTQTVNWTAVSGTPGYARATTLQPQYRSALMKWEIGAKADIDIACSLRVVTTNPFNAGGSAYFIGGLVARGNGLVSNESGYGCGLRIETTGVKGFTLRKYVNGTVTTLVTVNYSWNDNEWHQMRLQVVGSAIRAKAWPASTAEPAAWTIDTTDTSVTAAGWAGIAATYYQTGGSTVEFDYFGWDANNVGVGSNPVPGNNYTVAVDTIGSYVVTGQAVALTTSSTAAIGGVPIGSTGSGFFAGLKLVWGDDFDTKPLPFNLRPAIAANASGNITGTFAVTSSRGARFSNDPEVQVFTDASYRGPRHESPTDIAGADGLSVTASVLSMTASLRPSSLDAHVSYIDNTGNTDAIDDELRPKIVTSRLMSTPSFRFSAAGNWAVEAMVELPPGTLNGFHHGGLWTTGENWPHQGEVDILEGWLATSRATGSTIHVSAVDGGPDIPIIITTANSITVPTGRKVWVAAVRSGGTVSFYDDFATAGTLALRGSTSDSKVARLKGGHAVIAQLAVNTKLSNAGVYDAGDWPQSVKLDWIRAWTPSAAPNNTVPVVLSPVVNTSPGGSWASTFPSALSLYGSPLPDLEEILGYYDNEDNPGALRRDTYPNLPQGMTVDSSARTTAGTVPTTEGGRTALLLVGTWTAGGPAKMAVKLFNVAPARQPSLFPSGYLAIGETFSRTIAYTDYHSGNLGPHTYTVTKSAGGTDFTITGSGSGTVTITGNVLTAETSTFTIQCVNTAGQTTTTTRSLAAAPRPFHFDFRHSTYLHAGTIYADFADVVAAGRASFTQPLPSFSGNYYEEDLYGQLTAVSGVDTPRISDKGLVYEGAVTNMMGGATATEARILTNATVVSNILVGPSGSITADRLVETIGNGVHQVSNRTGGVSYTSGLPYLFQAYVKQGSARYCQLVAPDSAFVDGQAFITIDMKGGVISGQGTAVTASGITFLPYLGKGWVRAWFWATPDATTSGSGGAILGFCADNPSAVRLPSYVGNVNNFFYVWGVGLEQRAVTTTIPVFVNNGATTSVSNTKPADDLKVLLPAGTTSLRLVFDDDSTQDISGLTAGTLVSVPIGNRPTIVAMFATSGLVHYSLAAGIGFYAHTGSPVTLVAGATLTFNLTVGAGPYAVSGQPVTLSRTTISAYTLAAAGGGYTLTGNPVALTRFSPGAIKVTAIGGVYALTGKDVTLRTSQVRKLAVNTGAYTLAGKAVALAKGGTVNPNPEDNIRVDLSGLHPVAVIEMFEFDDRGIGGTTVLRWHAGTTIQLQPITWQGKTYDPFPVEGSGWALQQGGPLPRPSLKFSNIGGSVGAYLRRMADAIGAKVTRRRTIAKYMDAINFPLGNVHADPTAHFPDEIYYVARKASMNSIFIELELAVSYDVSGVQLPRRQVVAGTCPWIYRSPECGYQGPPVQDIQGNPTTNPAKDRCRKTLSACKARFGKNGILNTGAFPASTLISGG